jgi:hypothetical protein
VHAPPGDKSDDKKDTYEEVERIFDHFPKYHVKILLADFNSKAERERQIRSFQTNNWE